MPNFRKLNREEIATMPRAGKKVDLTEYVDFLQDLEPGDFGEVDVSNGDPSRTVKRRLTTAAKRLQLDIKWRRRAGDALRFEVLDIGNGVDSAVDEDDDDDDEDDEDGE